MCINRRKTMSEMFRWNTKSVAYLSSLTRTLWKLEPRRKMLKAFEVDIATMKPTHPTLHHGLSFIFLPIFFSDFFLLSTFIKILTECSSSSLQDCARHCHHKADRNSELPQEVGGLWSCFLCTYIRYSMVPGTLKSPKPLEYKCVYNQNLIGYRCTSRGSNLQWGNLEGQKFDGFPM